MAKKDTNLDLKDKKLLYHLDFHARDSYAQLAKKVGLSKQGVEYKIKNLIKKKVIEGFYPVINVPKLGYIYCRIGIVIQADEEKEKEILAHLHKDKRYFWLFSTQGAFDLLIAVWAKNISDFHNAVNDLLGKYGKWITRKELTVTHEVIHYQHRYFLNKKETEVINIKETNEKIEVDDTDKKILSLLCEDARIPLVKMAEITKIPVKTIGNHLKKLEKIKIIEGYRPIINHQILGYTYYKLWINIQYQSIQEIERLYQYIKMNPVVVYVVKGVGIPEDLDIEIIVKDNRELFAFIKDLRRKFPSLIQNYRTMTFLETQKVRYLPF